MIPSESSTSNGGFRALLHNRSFMLLWCGQGIAQIADKIFFVLLIALLVNYQKPDDAVNSMRSAVMVSATLPAILFGSAAGIFVDQVRKKGILTTCNYMRGVLTLLIPFLPKAFVVLLVIAFLESILTQFFAPAEQAAITLVVRHDELMPANALFTTTMIGSLIVGFAIGEPLLSLAKQWHGEFGQPGLVGGLYLVAAIVLQCARLKEARVKRTQATLHPLEDFKLGLQYLRRNVLLSNALLQLTMLYSVFAALTVLAIQLAQEVGLKSTQFGFLLAAAGIGMVLGAAFLGHWGNRFHHRPLPLVGFITMAVMLTAFAFVDALWLGLVLSVFLGLGAALIAIPMQTLIQRKTPEDMRGKVFGFQNNVVNIALSAPLAIAGPLTDAIGLRAVLMGISSIVVVGSLWAWAKTRRMLQDAI
jgi:MFS family permease